MLSSGVLMPPPLVLRRVNGSTTVRRRIRLASRAGGGEGSGRPVGGTRASSWHGPPMVHRPYAAGERSCGVWGRALRYTLPVASAEVPR
jgi:hypothetical protein